MLTTQIPFLEEKVKHLDNKILDRITEIHAKDLSLERTTKANEDFKSQNAWLIKKLESTLMFPLSPRSCILLNVILTPLQLIESDAELNTLKAMVENVVAFFYPNDSSFASRAPQLLDGLPTRSQEVIPANMKQSVSLTLRILKSLFPRANLDATGKGFVATCTDNVGTLQTGYLRIQA
jgi:hypothetical protein